MNRVNNMSTMQKQNEWDQKLGAKMCSCKREKIFYQCKEQSCVNHQTQPTYCGKCLSEGKHPHFPLHEILDIISKSDEQWTQLLERYATSVKNAKISYEKVEVLVRYFESEAIRIPAASQNSHQPLKRRISADYQTLIDTF